MAKRRENLTQEQVKAVLKYDPETGLFFRKMPKSRRHPVPRLILMGSFDCKGYVRVGVAGGNYPSHRIAWLYMTGEWPSGEIDHINRVKSDNRWANLREATSAENQANTPARKNNISGFKGASRVGCKWAARIRVNGTRHYLGMYDNPKHAHEAYAAASRKFYGEFAEVSR
jgi:hypothetical protein